jgi:hypothetical protein
MVLAIFGLFFLDSCSCSLLFGCVPSCSVLRFHVFSGHTRAARPSMLLVLRLCTAGAATAAAAAPRGLTCARADVSRERLWRRRRFSLLGSAPLSSEAVCAGSIWPHPEEFRAPAHPRSGV